MSHLAWPQRMAERGGGGVGTSSTLTEAMLLYAYMQTASVEGGNSWTYKTEPHLICVLRMRV